MSLIFGEQPLEYVPSPDRRQYVPWLTRGDREFVGGLEMGPNVMLVAHGLTDAALYPHHIARPVRSWLKLGLLLEPEVYLLQLPLKSRLQWQAQMNVLLQDRGARHLDLERQVSPKELTDFAQSIVDQEIKALATAIVTPTPLLRDGSLAALDNAIKLFEEAERYFTYEQLAEPPGSGAEAPLPRQLLAAITIERKTLHTPRYVRRILDAYSDATGMYGYFVQVANMARGGVEDVSRLSEFLYELRERTNRPVIPAKLGPLGIGYLAGGLDGYACGIGAAEYLAFPCRPPNKARPDNDRGFAVTAYNHQLLRNMHVTGKHAAAGKRAFHRIECACGFHEDGKAPVTNKQRKQHTLYWRLEQSRHAVEEGAAWLLPAVDLAERQSAAIEPTNPHPGYYTAMRATLPPLKSAQSGDAA